MPIHKLLLRASIGFAIASMLGCCIGCTSETSDSGLPDPRPLGTIDDVLALTKMRGSGIAAAGADWRRPARRWPSNGTTSGT